MYKRPGAALFVSVLTLTVHPLLAQSAVETMMCRNGLFPAGKVGFSLAQVSGNGQLHFLKDLAGCPESGEADCQQRAYVVPGDVLLVSKKRGRFQCAYYPNKSGGSAGWIPSNRMSEVVVDTAPKSDRWAGKWVDGDNTLKIDIADQKLHMQGEAWWPGKNPPPEDFPYGPNMGEVAANAKPDGNAVTFLDGECRIQAVLVNDYLVVHDNHVCGGMNVNFDGVYRKNP